MRGIFSFERIRALSLVLAFSAGIIPFATYITDETSGLLWLMMAANIFAYVMIALTTIRITLDAANREKAKIAVPAKYADDPVRRKWYAAVKLSQKWHLLAVIPRFALAFALMQHLHKSINYAWQCAAPYCYSSHYGYGDAPLIYPQIETVLIGWVVLLLFALAEVRLLCGAGMLVDRSRWILWNMIDVIGLRVILIMAVLLLLLPVSDVYLYVRGCAAISIDFCWNRDGSNQLKNSQGWADTDYYHAMQERDKAILRVLDTGYLSLYSVLDNGVGIAVNLMRPVGEDSLFAVTFREVDDGGIYVEFDNRSFVARQIVAGLLGLLLYALLTRGMLWLVRKQPVVNAAEAYTR